MSKLLAKRIDQGTANAIENPEMSAVIAALMGFIAGVQCVFVSDDLARPLSLARDCFIFCFFLLMAAEQGYFLSRAVRELRKAAD